MMVRAPKTPRSPTSGPTIASRDCRRLRSSSRGHGQGVEGAALAHARGRAASRRAATVTGAIVSGPSAEPDELAQSARSTLRIGEQQELGPLGPEHLAGMVEQRRDRRVELGRVVEQSTRLVEQLEPFVLLALADVGPIGEEHDGRRHGEQEDRPRVDLDDHDREQRQAGVGHRDHRAEAAASRAAS